MKTSTTCRVISGGIRGDDGVVRGYGETIEIADDQLERFTRSSQVEVIAPAPAPAAESAPEGDKQ